MCSGSSVLCITGWRGTLRTAHTVTLLPALPNFSPCFPSSSAAHPPSSAAHLSPSAAQ
jgi:hypothetical protein